MVTRIGTSGWSYDHWEPELYPAGLPARDRLARYAEAFSTAELNSSFYRWPGPASFRGWRQRVAVEFRHPSWHCEEVFGLLARHQAAYCVTSGGAGQDVFVYFNNDGDANAVRNARTLRHLPGAG